MLVRLEHVSLWSSIWKSRRRQPIFPGCSWGVHWWRDSVDLWQQKNHQVHRSMRVIDPWGSKIVQIRSSPQVSVKNYTKNNLKPPNLENHWPQIHPLNFVFFGQPEFDEFLTVWGSLPGLLIKEFSQKLAATLPTKWPAFACFFRAGTV